VQVLEIRKTFQEQDAVDQHVGVLHLADRLVIGDLAEALEAPVVVHPRVQEVLVDRRQLVGEHRVQQLDDRRFALHGALLEVGFGTTVNRPAGGRNSYVGKGAARSIKSAITDCP